MVALRRRSRVWQCLKANRGGTSRRSVAEVPQAVGTVAYISRRFHYFSQLKTITRSLGRHLAVLESGKFGADETKRYGAIEK